MIGCRGTGACRRQEGSSGSPGGGSLEAAHALEGSRGALEGRPARPEQEQGISARPGPAPAAGGTRRAPGVSPPPTAAVTVPGPSTWASPWPTGDCTRPDPRRLPGCPPPSDRSSPNPRRVAGGGRSCGLVMGRRRGDRERLVGQSPPSRVERTTSMFRCSSGNSPWSCPITAGPSLPSSCGKQPSRSPTTTNVPAAFRLTAGRPAVSRSLRAHLALGAARPGGPTLDLLPPGSPLAEDAAPRLERPPGRGCSAPFPAPDSRLRRCPVLCADSDRQPFRHTHEAITGTWDTPRQHAQARRVPSAPVTAAEPADTPISRPPLGVVMPSGLRVNTPAEVPAPVPGGHRATAGRRADEVVAGLGAPASAAADAPHTSVGCGRAGGAAQGPPHLNCVVRGCWAYFTMAVTTLDFTPLTIT